MALSVADYAVHRGCSDSYIRRMRRLGKLVMHADGKRILVAQSDALLDDVTDPVRGGDRSPGAELRRDVPTARVPPGDVPSVQEAVRRERLARARTAELELGELSKELTRVKGVERAVFTLVRQALNSMMNMSGRLRAKLAAESDPRAVEAMLDAEVRQIAEAMQMSARNLLGASARDASADADEEAG
ncbi:MULTISPECIES: hypothetical protein [unclassified Xanthomonas]|uniref:hypothetical protein n=1 Tax=unclassified Xanthomonas TaxID=2643310 RepID=UPI002A8319FB|nr:MULTISPECIES: hypothetical protein [unclassified Xanthomonas]MDY4296816.1 hypothetical protein [Xanthomonas sp. LF02-5]MDY4358425.1 hypothetical protein [Xanthomonas sp. LF04-12]